MYAVTCRDAVIWSRFYFSDMVKMLLYFCHFVDYMIFILTKYADTFWPILLIVGKDVCIICLVEHGIDVVIIMFVSAQTTL